MRVMRGKDAGKEGEILHIVTRKQKKRVIVKGVNMAKKHQKPNPVVNLPGGILDIEKAIDISNVMLIDPADGKPTKVGVKITDGSKVRFAKRTGNIIK